MRLVAGRRLGRSHLQLIPLSLVHLLLLVSAVAVGGVPLRIANDGVDSVVLAPIGRETIIIDTASNFHVERIDSPMELIEIRLIDDNSSTPLLIDIQKVESTEQQTKVQQAGERLEDAFPLLPPSNEESKESGSGEVPADTVVDPSPSPSSTTTTATTSVTDVEPYEECLYNERWLDADTVQKLKQRQRKLWRLVNRLNRQMDMYCRLDRSSASAQYRKCPQWREEKMVHYYKLMRLKYCSDYSKWPNAQRIKRDYGPLFPWLERLYAFWE